MNRVSAFLGAGMLVLAGCGGSSEASDTTSSQLDQYKEAVAEDEETSSDGEVESTETTARPEVTIPDEFNQPEDEILATYNAYNEASLLAFGPPVADPDYASLYEFVVDPHAGNIREGIEENKAAGKIIVNPVNSELSHSVRFVGAFDPERIEGNSVTLLDCFVDATEVRTIDGDVLESEPVTYVLAVEMRVVDGAWKVAAEDVKEQYEGVSECEEYANL